MNTQIIDPKIFPSTPKIIKNIHTLFKDSNLSNTLLVSTLEQDPLLCANILKLVNSPYYGLSRKIISMQQAVTLLGRVIIRGIVMATVLKKSFSLNLDPYKITLEEFERISTLRVFFLKEWLKGSDYELENLLSVAFLMETGIVITSYTLTQNNLQNKFLSLQNEYSILESEKILFNMNSYEVAAMLYEKWDFDEDFTNMLSCVKTPKTMEDNFLYVLSLLIGIDGILSDESIQRSLEAVKEKNLNEQSFLKAIETIKDKFF